MIVPELDPVWVIAYWTVMSVAVAVSIWAGIVRMSDFRASRHADVDHSSALRVARPRVDPPAHPHAPLAAVPRLRPRDPRFHDPVN